MFTPPPTSQCEDCSGRAPAWSCSLPELSFPSSRRCFFALLLLYIFPSNRLSLSGRCLFCSFVIVHFAFLVVIVLLSSYCTLCLSSRLSLSGCYLFWLLPSCSVLFIFWCSQHGSALFIFFIFFGVALSCFCIFCGVLPTRRYSSRDCIKLWCIAYETIQFVCFSHLKNITGKQPSQENFLVLFQFFMSDIWVHVFWITVAVCSSCN